MNNNPVPSNWQSSLRGLAATCFLVALGLYLAVQLIKAVAVVLIVLAAIAAAIYLGVCITRYRKSKW